MPREALGHGGRTMAPATGPYVNAAYFCRPSLLPNGQYAVPPDNWLGAVDQRGDSPDMPALPFRAALLLMFRSGLARGRVNIAVVGEGPDGSRMAPVSLVLICPDEERPLVRFLDLELCLELPGVYWFSVLVGEQLLTRVPLRVRYLPVGRG